MAKAYKCPEELGDPWADSYTDGKFDVEKMFANDEAFREKIRTWIREHPGPKPPSKSSRDLIGASVFFPIADGAAEYIVWQTSPLSLIHVPVGDAWNAAPETIRGLRVSDVRDRVDRDRKVKAMFAERRSLNK